MITWITTVGWSPFAVINPIWAYLKENDDFPNKVILIHTQNERIKQNIEIIRKYIIEILKEYSNGDFDSNNITLSSIESEDIQTYADNLKNLINIEITKTPKKIVLDMTPGRKYMSAINVYYGLKASKVPIQVFYLHLEENKYQEIPYPLTPIIKSELIDVIDSTEVFSKNFEDLISDEDSSEDLKLNAMDFEKLILKMENNKKKREILLLLAIHNGFKSKTKISKFLSIKGMSVQNIQLKEILSSLINQQLIISKKMSNEFTPNFTGFDLTEKGKNNLVELYQSSK